MIVVMHTPGKITLTGHAGYAPPGKDVVCASVSILEYTLTESLEKAKQNIGYSCQGDKTVITYEDLTEPGRLLIGSFFIGIKAIAAEYPDHVTCLGVE